MFDFDQFLQDLLSEGFVWSSNQYLVKSVWVGNGRLIDTYTPNENDGSYLHQQFRSIGGHSNQLVNETRIACTFS